MGNYASGDTTPPELETALYRLATQLLSGHQTAAGCVAAAARSRQTYMGVAGGPASSDLMNRYGRRVENHMVTEGLSADLSTTKPSAPAATRKQHHKMLRDADHLARKLLMDVAGDDAGPMLRSWPALVDASSQLWVTLPGRRRDPDER